MFQHKFNVLHIYCRLRDLGFSKKNARILASFLENSFLYHKLLYNKG